MHFGCDAQTGYVHSVTATAANAHDITEAHNLIRDDDDVVYGDSGYLGIEKREEIKGDKHLSKVEFRIAKRPSSLKSKLNNGGIDWDREIERRKASVRSKIEWPHLVVKRQFGYCRAGELSSFARFPSDVRGKSPAGSPSRRFLNGRGKLWAADFPRRTFQILVPNGYKGRIQPLISDSLSF